MSGHLSAYRSGSGLAEVINTETVKLKILRRYPASGLPVAGTPFALDVEVQTERLGAEFVLPQNWFSFGGVFRCKDAVVAARGMYDKAGRIFGVTNVTTSTFNDCIGSARLVFDADFIPNEKHWIRLEVYPEGTKRSDIESGKAKPLTTTTDFLFNRSEADLRRAGVVDDPNKSPAEHVTDAIQTAGNVTRNLAIIATIGAGVYLTAPFWPAISKRISKAIS